MRFHSWKLAIQFAALLAAGQALAQSALEIPQPGSTQSGISIVSGWHCEAGRVEVAFDGGERIAVAYGTTRADTRGPCGDDNNGFSLLWAYNLLGSGTHEVVAYADGVEFGRATFNVTDISNKDFLRDRSAETRVGVFPDFEHDVVLKWQEANQNFIISDYLPSRDPYAVAGIWELYGGLSFDYIMTIYSFDYPEDPDVVGLVGLMSDLEADTFVYAGMLEGNLGVMLVDPEGGADFTGEFILRFTGEREGTAQLMECSPCPVPAGTLLQLVRVWPDEEALASGPANTGTPGVQGVSAAPKALVRRSALDAAYQKLKELLEK